MTCDKTVSESFKKNYEIQCTIGVPIVSYFLQNTEHISSLVNRVRSEKNQLEQPLNVVSRFG